jgi:hypothetical protein
MRVATHGLSVVAILVAGLVVAACAGSDDKRGLSEGVAARTRGAVLSGAKRDFHYTVGVPRDFAECFTSAFGHTLTDKRLEALVAIRERRGEPAAARALNDFGAPVGDSCGGRQWVPELTTAAKGLRPAP